jgi:Flp pilus assembly pilin Flp
MEIMNTLRALLRGDDGQDLLEYALLFALIALMALAAVDEAGEQIAAFFSNIATTFASAA